MIVAALAAPTLSIAGDRDAFPRDAVIRKAKEAVKIAEDVTYEYESFLRGRPYCPTNSRRERDLLTGLKEVERRAGHVIKAAITGCMPTTIERRAEYLRKTVERTDILAVRVGVKNLPCDIPGELELIDELACEVSALTRTRLSHRDRDFDRHDVRDRDFDRDRRDDHVRRFDDDDDDRGRRDDHIRRFDDDDDDDRRRRTLREIPTRHDDVFRGHPRGRTTTTTWNPYLHRSLAHSDVRFGSRGWEVRFYR